MLQIQEMRPSSFPAKKSSKAIPVENSRLPKKETPTLLESLWENLADIPHLEDIAKIASGVNYASITPCPEGSSEAAIPGETLVDSEMEPYLARPATDLRSDPALRQGDDLPWEQPHVLVRVRRSCIGGRWPLIAAIDEAGLVCPQDWYAVWPRNDMPLEVLAALINGPVVNAFFALQSGFSSERALTLLTTAPIPRLAKWQIREIRLRVSKYRAKREQWHQEEEQEGRTARACRNFFQLAESEVIGAYNLPFPMERELRNHFAGYCRPSALSLHEVEPSYQNGLHRTIMQVEEVKDEGGEQIVEVDIWGWDEEESPGQIVQFPLALIPSEMRAQITRDVCLWVNINTGAKSARNLIFEDFEVASEPKEKFCARIA